MSKLHKVILLLILLTQTGWAQFTKNVEISSFFDDNLYRSPYPVSDLFTDLDLNLIYRSDNSGIGFFYEGNFFLYQEAKDRNFSIHELGLSYSGFFGSSDEHTFYFGAEGSLRLDDEAYNYYDYRQLYLYTNMRFDFSYLFLKTGYNFRYRDYANLSYLTNSQHYGYIQINKPFETYTTFILETDLGYKTFTEQEIYSSYSSSGHGQGSMSNMLPMETVTSYVPSLSHIILLARIAQSLHEKFGIYIQYSKKINLGSSFGLSNSEGYYQDEELFDDPFSYESDGISSQITWILPWAMRLQVGGNYLSKSYISEQAYLSAEDTLAQGGLRADNQNYYFVNFSKSFYFNESWLRILKINIFSNFIDNTSNSYWYNYKNLIVGGGVQWSF